MSDSLADAFEYDLDGTCIKVDLSRLMTKAIADAKGWAWDEDDFTEGTGDIGAVLDEVWIALEALINAGAIRREHYDYDDETHQWKMVA